MYQPSTNPKQTTSWNRLRAHAQACKQHKITTYQEPRVIQTPIGPISYHYQYLTPEIQKDLELFVDEMQLQARKEALLIGEAINTTEQRAVLHPALRSPWINPQIQGVPIQELITPATNALYQFVDRIHSDGDFTDVIHIGIGGSDLGPKCVVQSLRFAYKKKLNIHFVSTVDGHALEELLPHLNASKTLVVVASKTFTTQETMINAARVKQWLQSEHAPLEKHLVALTTNQIAAQAFGVSSEQMFGFWDWVGGRYSLWSAIGLPIALAYGNDVFKELKRGAETADKAFFEQESNPASILALLGIWNTTFLDFTTECVAVYDSRLETLPLFLQQLRMESNGKGVDLNGQPLTYHTSPILLPAFGTDCQHSFFQQFHQGLTPASFEFYTVKTPAHTHQDQHAILLSHAYGQMDALAIGDTETTFPYKNVPGNKPIVHWEIETLNAFSLGYLLATQEHRTFVQGQLYSINSFDQFGVELGKRLALKRQSLHE